MLNEDDHCRAKLLLVKNEGGFTTSLSGERIEAPTRYWANYG